MGNDKNAPFAEKEIQPTNSNTMKRCSYVRTEKSKQKQQWDTTSTCDRRKETATLICSWWDWLQTGGRVCGGIWQSLLKRTASVASNLTIASHSPRGYTCTSPSRYLLKGIACSAVLLITKTSNPNGPHEGPSWVNDSTATQCNKYCRGWKRMRLTCKCSYRKLPRCGAGWRKQGAEKPPEEDLRVKCEGAGGWRHREGPFNFFLDTFSFTF